MDYTVVASADMDAPPDRVYAIIADYHNGHPHILPKQFRNLTVEKGGVGAGTDHPVRGPRAGADAAIQGRS